MAAADEDDLDGPWKEAIELFLPQLLELFALGMYREIDWSQPFEFRDKELPRIAPKGKAGGHRVVDKLVRVRLLTGAEAWVLIHIEVQSQRRDHFARRMFRYFARLRERFPEHPVVSLAILGDDSPDWRPGGYAEEQWGCSLDFRFPVVKLLDFAARRHELETMRNPVAAVILAHLAVAETRRDPARRLAEKLALVRNLSRMGYDRDTAFKQLRLIDWLLKLPDDLEEQWWEAVEQAAAETDMTYITSFERRALSKGREEGKAEGKAEGMAEGMVEGEARILAGWVRAALGPDAEPIAKAVSAARDAKVLDAVQEALRSGGSAEVIGAILAGSTAGR